MKGRRSRMNIDPPQNIDAPVNLLAEAHDLYRWSAEELIRAIKALRNSDIPDAKGAGAAIRDLRTALSWALDERNHVEKIGKTLAAASCSTNEYDLDAARVEIGGRLARLRAARDDGAVSGQSQ